MSQGKRYKFQGSSLSVQTALGSPKTISGITQADPAVVTSTNHLLETGDIVFIEDVVGMVELNDLLFVVDDAGDSVGDDTFELSGVDSSGYSAYVSGGTAKQATMSEFCELTGANQQDGTSDEIDATTICSNAKEFEVGLSDSGTIQLDYNFAPNQPVQSALRAAKTSGDIIAVKIIFPGDGGTVIMLGAVQQSSFQGSNSGLWTGSTTFKLTGEIFVLPA